jgi:hypothetical protein
LFNQLDPVLQEAGRERENEWEEYLTESVLEDLTHYSDRPEDDRRLPGKTSRRLRSHFSHSHPVRPGTADVSSWWVTQRS